MSPASARTRPRPRSGRTCPPRAAPARAPPSAARRMAIAHLFMQGGQAGCMMPAFAPKLALPLPAVMCPAHSTLHRIICSWAGACLQLVAPAPQADVRAQAARRRAAGAHARPEERHHRALRLAVVVLVRLPEQEAALARACRRREQAASARRRAAHTRVHCWVETSDLSAR